MAQKQLNLLLAPDGRTIAFVAGTEGGRPLLWRRRIDEVAAQVLPGTEGAQDLFWSPDSRWIGFFAEGKLKKVLAAGGVVQVVVPAVRDVRGGTWGRGDAILFSNGNDPIQRVTAGGGELTPMASVAQDESSHRYPQFLPDGDHYLYLSLGKNGQNKLYVSSLQDKSRKVVAQISNSAVYAAPGYLLFADGNSLFGQPFDTGRVQTSGQPFLIADHVGRSSTFKSAVSTSTTVSIAYADTLSPKSSLTWFDRDGRLLESTGPEGYYTDFCLSPNEKSLAASRLDPRTGIIEVWISDLVRGSNIRILRGGASLNATPIWSPDGAQFVFRTSRGVVEFYQRSAAGGGTEQVVLSYEVIRAAGIQSNNLINTDWSSDGKNILFSVPSPSSGTDLWLLPLTGARRPVRFLASPADEMHGNFSPDVHLVAYTSNESGKFQVYVQSLPLSERKWRVSTTGGYEPRWRADGREIYYLSEDRKLTAVSVGVGPSFGVPRALFQTRVLPGVTANRMHYVPSRNGQRFLINTQSDDPSTTPITVVMNWAAALRK